MKFFWKKFGRPLMFKLDAEGAHEMGIKALEMGLASPFYCDSAAGGLGPIERFGLRFANPIGIAAGFDKNGVAVEQLSRLGFGFVEVGTVTLKPQKGNEKPRLFRLPKDQALINRLGFNNDGAEVVAKRLVNLEKRCVVGVNIGKNKDVPNEEAVENYLAALELVHPVADYIAVNISSPNTPDLRDLQNPDQLDELLAALQKRNNDLREDTGRNESVEMRKPAGSKGETVDSDRSTLVHTRVSAREVPPEGGTLNIKPLLVKIAPDLDEQEIEALVDVAIRNGVAGIIATNTTISRDGLKTKNIASFGAGGLSGKPLSKMSNAVITQIFKYTKGKLPIIGVGGIFTAEDAFEKIASGASLIQAYTGFVYGGPTFPLDINEELLQILLERGFSTLDDAVGSGI
ncbi:MAG: quinone-dependent dihydroorotate dehydrogenase [Pyrinomonadaceae bacterium]